MKNRTNFLFQLCRKRRVDHPRADLLPRLGQGPDVVDVERVQPRVDALAQAAFVEEQPEGFGRRRKSVGNPQPGRRQLAEHLAQ